ncbi:hypothetical protein PROFUN_15481 [Planoprotostelium fungivorum]|uniref:Uncharacterized protein n=1 Tax=Planoprotostelium fungivorum TaxID=1890364 RepID=A0A2P6MUL5_9EUKA|nr:hypothetical protein PROFUN_15481 [Planoprotostelium fungivorum]
MTTVKNVPAKVYYKQKYDQYKQLLDIKLRQDVSQGLYNNVIQDYHTDCTRGELCTKYNLSYLKLKTILRDEHILKIPSADVADIKLRLQNKLTTKKEVMSQYKIIEICRFYSNICLADINSFPERLLASQYDYSLLPDTWFSQSIMPSKYHLSNTSVISTTLIQNSFAAGDSVPDTKHRVHEFIAFKLKLAKSQQGGCKGYIVDAGLKNKRCLKNPDLKDNLCFWRCIAIALNESSCQGIQQANSKQQRAIALRDQYFAQCGQNTTDHVQVADLPAIYQALNLDLTVYTLDSNLNVSRNWDTLTLTHKTVSRRSQQVQGCSRRCEFRKQKFSRNSPDALAERIWRREMNVLRDYVARVWDDTDWDEKVQNEAVWGDEENPLWQSALMRISWQKRRNTQANNNNVPKKGRRTTTTTTPSEPDNDCGWGYNGEGKPITIDEWNQGND